MLPILSLLIFRLTAGAFQKTFAGKQDGVIIKTNPDLSNILFSTFLGGSGNDAAFVLAINPTDGNIYVGGNTDGTDLPGDKTNVLQAASQGGETEGFVSIINIDGSALLKTSYIGTAGNDMLYGIQFDKFSFPYIMGTTTSDNWPVINAAFSQSKGKQFIAKLKPDLSGYEYSTVFGSGEQGSKYFTYRIFGRQMRKCICFRLGRTNKCRWIIPIQEQQVYL
ncbi:MAG: hypothetical protein WKG06_46980 [Segetibacter sp.]